MTDSPYRASRLVLQAKLFTVAKTLGAIVALAYQFLLVRHLSVPDYVSFTILTSANGILVFATMFGMDRLVYRYIPPLREVGRWREMLVFLGGLLILRQTAIGILLVSLGWLAIGYLPDQIASEVGRLPWHYAWYAIAVGFTDSMATFCNSLGRQGRQAMLMLGMTALRFVLSGIMIAHHGSLSAVEIGNILVGTELLLVFVLFLVLIGEARLLAKSHPTVPFHFGFDWRSMVLESLSTQMTYMLSLPFRGGVMKLIVGAVATPIVTASFGFFQTIADRAYQFMPIFMFKGIVEPALANDYAKRGDISRVRLTASLLMRLNTLILMAALAVLVACGTPLIDFATRNRYGSEVGIAALLLVQMGAMTVGEALWIALNPVGRIVHHNRVWVWVAILCYTMIGAAAALHNPALLIIASCLPYAMVYGWLRWLSKEPVLEKGMGFGWFWRLMLPVAISVAAGRACAWLTGTSPVAAVFTASLTVIVFLLVLRRQALISIEESAAVATLSPRLAKILSMITASR